MPVAWWPFKKPLAAQPIAVRSDESSIDLGVSVGVAIKVGLSVGVAVGRGRFVAVEDAGTGVIVGDALLSALGVSDVRAGAAAKMRLLQPANNQTISTLIASLPKPMLPPRLRRIYSWGKSVAPKWGAGYDGIRGLVEILTRDPFRLQNEISTIGQRRGLKPGRRVAG